MLIQMGSISLEVLADQMTIQKRLKWVHSLSAGIDAIVGNKDFQASPIPLTNAKGAYSEILGEFVALGVLYHTKHLESFIKAKD